MKGYFSKVLATLFFAFAAFSASAQPAKTITIAADEWCPINCAPNSKEEGIGIDLARKVFEPLGYKVEYKIMPWAEALKQVREGKVHAVVGASRSDDKTLIFPDNAITEIVDGFYVRAGSPWRYQGVHTLKNKRIGIIEDYGYGEIVTSFIKKNQYTAGALHIAKGKTPLQDNIKQLLDAKIDVLVESRIVMDYTLKTSNLSDKILLAGSVPQDHVYLAFSPALPQSKALAAQYDTAIRSMKTSGALKRMYGKYGLVP
ncbi:MAG: substrate-binding periplasmic protein [Alphaproteobacteria bacterium]